MICSVDGCGGKAVGRTLCNKHYRRWLHHGDPLYGRPKRNDGEGTISPFGYVMLQENYGRIFEHVKVAEIALGKTLPVGSEVHHVNGIRSDNRPSNLVICQDRPYHKLLHVRMNAIKAGHPPYYRKCPFCKQYDDPANLRKTNTGQVHVECVRAYDQARNLAIKEKRTERMKATAA